MTPHSISISTDGMKVQPCEPVALANVPVWSR